MVQVRLLLLIGLLWAVPVQPQSDLSFVYNVQRVIGILKRPSQISTVFCGNVDKEFGLIRALSALDETNAIPTTRMGANSEYYQHLFIVDIGHCGIPELVSIFSTNPKAVAYSQWLMINTLNPSSSSDIREIKNIFGHVNLSQTSEVLFLVAEEETLKLLMVYKMERVHSSDVVVEDMGFFANLSTSSYTDTRSHKVTSMRRKDMGNRPFPIASVLTNPDSINHYFDFVDVEVDTVGKSGHRLGVAVLQFFNATPQIVLSNSWGSFNVSSGQWSGMMGDLISGSAEFGGTPSFMRSERVDIVEYMSISLESWTRIVFRAPKLSYTTNVYLLPFERSVWAAAMALFAVMTLLLLVAATGEWKLAQAQATEEQRPRFIDIVFVIFSAICNQGSSFQVHSVGGRIILLSCLVMVVCLFVSYCAFIVVLLQSPSTNIKTTQDLINSRMQIGAEDTIYNRYWLKRLTDPVEKAIYEKRLVNKDGSTNFFSLEEGVRSVQQNLFAFHMETPVGYRVVSKLYDESEKCDLREISFANMAFPYGTCRKDSPYKEALRIGMLRVKEHGIQKRLWKEVYATKPKCTTRSAFAALTMIDISPAIVILCFGCSVSLLIFCGEVLTERYKKRGV